MKFFFDTEFIEDGKTIEPISIGIVDIKGRAYYREFDVDLTCASPWVQENVVPHLLGVTKSKEFIRDEIVEFVGKGKHEFWAYYADYDWVLMAQLFGTMMELPRHWPRFCMDLRQYMVHARFDVAKRPEQTGTAHNALDDALWNRMCYARIKQFELTGEYK